MSAAVLVDPVKISSANGLFEELYSMVYENLCSVPNPPTAIRNILNTFFDSVNITSLDDVEDEGDLEGSYFMSGYHEADAVFYPFQPVDVVEVGFFLETVAKWVVVLNCLEQRAMFLRDFELKESVYLWKEQFNILTDSAF